MSLLSDDVRSQLIAIYSGGDRHYHDLHHIKTLLALADEHAREISDGEAIEAAIWFHDAVYDTRKHDNEEESAKLAIQLLAGAAAPGRIELIAAMVRASANHRVPGWLETPAANDCAMFLDMDLAILGSPAVEYAAYERAVRQEYAWVSETEWIAGRSHVLRSFLARPFIYASPQFRASREAAARSNLMQSLALLERCKIAP